ncbi:MAG TPA: hypothetical protein PK777_01045 [Thermoguttaceae bacterium]|nr:hypothetical protein [Thermoguttaceae bacterium]HPP51507.1 hypothetical protein [Thermoguttaceae bacterium]
MTVRERWTVYPLLILALGIAVRDKFWPANLLRVRTLAVDTLQAKEAAVTVRLVCTEMKAQGIQTGQLETLGLTLVAPDGVVRGSLLGQLAHGGQLVLYNREGKPVLLAGVEPASNTGIVEITSPDGPPLVQLRSAAGHGVVNTIDHDGTIVCSLGSDGQNAGLFLELPRLQKVLPLRTVPLPPEAAQRKAKP